jgi:hypothetical protein
MVSGITGNTIPILNRLLHSQFLSRSTLCHFCSKVPISRPRARTQPSISFSRVFDRKQHLFWAFDRARKFGIHSDGGHETGVALGHSTLVFPSIPFPAETAMIARLHSGILPGNPLVRGDMPVTTRCIDVKGSGASGSSIRARFQRSRSEDWTISREAIDSLLCSQRRNVSASLSRPQMQN